LPRKSKKVTAPSPQLLVPEDDKAAKEAKFATEAYNKVARSASLDGIMLVKAAFNIKPAFYKSVESEKRPSLSYSSEMSNDVFDDSTGIAGCVWTWNVEAKQGKSTTLSIEASYRILYKVDAECDPAAVRRYLARVSRFATYPYFRAHVSQISWESSAGLPVMPTISA